MSHLRDEMEQQAGGKTPPSSPSLGNDTGPLGTQYQAACRMLYQPSPPVQQAAGSGSGEERAFSAIEAAPRKGSPALE